MSNPQISPAELRQLIATEPRLRLVDVRTGGEFEAGHIPGSYNVPVDALGEHHRDLVEVRDPVVLVCQSGNRARRAEAALRDAGMENVRVLDGGMNAWIRDGGEVATIKPRWPLERQVRLVAGSIVSASILASLAVPELKWVAGAIGAGLTFAALTDTCAMGTLLSKLPYNRAAADHCATAIARLREEATA